MEDGHSRSCCFARALASVVHEVVHDALADQRRAADGETHLAEVEVVAHTVDSLETAAAAAVQNQTAQAR